jgi:hypothetical protein
MHIDWQTIVTLGIGAAALGYVARRWWPGLIGLFKASTADKQADGSCGQPNAPTASGTCGSGCGNCGQTTAFISSVTRLTESLQILHKRHADVA